ncbi:MAG: plastocyanin/azurin family copper-binding protein [Haloferacaceae archaeon]
MTDNTSHDASRDGLDEGVALARRAILRVAGASAALSLGAGAVATAHDPGGDSSTPHPDDGSWHSDDVDPVFGKPSAGPNPCAGDASKDCFDEFHSSVQPSHEIEVHIEVPEILLLFGQFGDPGEVDVADVNAAVADGTVEEDELDSPDAEATIDLPDGSTRTLTAAEIARLLVRSDGFHYEPAGHHVRPGDVVLFSAETPDHGATVFHERHGRQNRVPEGAPPITAPVIPVGGYWLCRFEDEGVYDLYCPPHQVFGMVLRIVVSDGTGPVPSLRVAGDGRPPGTENLLPLVLGGFDPNVPSEAAALATDVLDPENVVSEDSVPWEDVVAEHRGS